MIDPAAFAKVLENDPNFNFVAYRDSKELLIYRDGVYISHGETRIEAEVKRITQGSGASTHTMKEIAANIRRGVYVERDAFDTDPRVINMANGLYSLTNGIAPHTPKYLSLHKSPIKYDPDAECPAIDKFIREVVTPDRVQTIYEIVGYAMAAKKNLKRAFIFEGDKNSGKSVMIALTERMVGIDATTHVSPLTVSRNTYGAAEYYGKQLNLVDDLGNTPIEDTGTLKSIIGGHRINAQFKYSQPFDYTPNTVCVFATNEVPTTTNIDEPYASRFSIITFPNIFEGKADNHDLIDDLTTPEELSGFFTKCMAALVDLMERGTFSGDGTLADRIKAYQNRSMPVTRFVDEVCVTDDPDDYISKDELYGAYVKWSRSQKLQTDSPGAMTTYLKSLGCVVRRVRGDDDSRYYAYCGITLKSTLDQY